MSSQTTRTSSAGSRHRETSFVETSGGLLTEQLIYKLRDESCGEDAVRPETFAHPGEGTPTTDAEIETQIGDAWADLEERWDEITRGYELYAMDVSEAREKWLLKLFEALGFEPFYQRENLKADEVEANLSHRGWEPQGSITADLDGPESTPPVLHAIRPDEDRPLDDGKHRGAEGRKQSPHDELQRYLNANEDVQWSIVTDGLKLRLLRDYYHTYTRGYVEFDLENIFTERNYDDFRALYRLCHASRFTPSGEADEDDDEEVETPVEQLYQVALSTGVKIGQDLQSNVVSAIETLGTGLLTDDVREALREGGEEEAKEYYQEVLLIVYRLLFLLYAEQRGMMASRKSLYTDEYAVSNLRKKAETRRSSRDENTDLWHGLEVTFRLVEEGNEELEVPCYNGMLFDSERLEWIDESECPNDALLDAIEDLTLIEYEGTRQRISYADLGVEEIGSVYESLLEFTPKLAMEVTELEDRTVSRGEFYLDDRGTERKETGSYYTDPGLVQELVLSALEPVVEDRLEGATTTDEKEDALLDISVCDPASGSGAFLIAANNFLAKRLAQIRAESDYPPEDLVREARRDVLQHCIYAVDLNPMAVELAKVSLWINSAVEDKPLNFLDHHIKCGNSLIGTNSELLEGEFPVDAYETAGGRDWHVGNEIRKRVRNENKERSKGSSESSLQQWGAGREEYVDIARQLDEIEEEDTEDIEKKQQLYDELQQSEAYQQEKLAHDIWTAAFYWPMDGSVKEYPSPSTIEKVRRNPDQENKALEELIGRATEISDQERFFHWELEFPEIFYNSDPGFDCILGNPPWDKIKLEVEEWFTGRNYEIANASTKRKRQNLIKELKQSDPELWEGWNNESKRIANHSKFIRDSGRYELTGKGELNTYSIFTELSGIELINKLGQTGLVVKTGIATDYRTSDFFAHLIDTEILQSLYDFVNAEGFFPDVHRNERFSLITISGEGTESDAFEFSFYNRNLETLHDETKRYELSRDEIAEINPNTKGCPTFKNSRIRDITVSIYESFSVLINEQNGDNPWSLDYHRLFDMTNDSSLFSDYETLNNEGFSLDERSIFQNDGEQFLPVYEAKLFHQFDHRFNSFGLDPTDETTRRVTDQEKQKTTFEILPRYWVHEEDFHNVVEQTKWDKDWIFSFRNVTDTTTNVRTAIGTVGPFVPYGNSAPVLTFSNKEPAKSAAVFTSIFNSITFDFLVRQSMGGVNFNLYILKQLAMPTPEQLDRLQINFQETTQTASSFLKERVLKLIWTSHSLNSFGRELSTKDSPYVWDADERRRLSVELDAAIASIYSIDRSDYEYMFDTFEILKDREESKFEKYKFKQDCLGIFDQISVDKDL